MKIFVFLFIVCCISCSKNEKIRDSGFINVGNLKIYYEREGKGDDVVLLHAGFQMLDMWDEQVSALKDKFKVLRIDMPAHGRTEGKDTSMLFADILKTIMDTLDISKASIAGSSMGAVAAQDFAIAYPDRVNKLILIAPGVNGLDKHKEIDSLSIAWYDEMMTHLENQDTSNAALAFTKAWAEGPYRTLDTNRPVTRYVTVTTRMNMLKHKLWGWPVMQQNPPAYERLSTLKMPVLIIHGDKDLPYIMETSKYLEATIPGSKRLLITDAAHLLNIEKASEVNKAMLSFL